MPQFPDVGDSQILSVDFWNDAGVSTDPGGANVTLTIVKPDGTTSTPAPTHGTAGAYTYVLDPDVAGWWTYTWEGHGNGVDTTERRDLLVGVTAAQAGPCEAWCSWEQVQNLAKPNLSAIPPEQRERLIDFATAILYGETGQRYPGYCHRTVSVCDCASWCCDPGYPVGNPAADSWYSGWHWGARCGWFRCTGFADHVDFGELRLPLVAVRDVTVGGAVISRDKWRVDDWRWLVRTDGSTWPSCVDLTDPAAFKATILYGRQPFAGGDDAAAALAAEMAKFYLEGSCNLPENVTDVIRSGITYRVRDSKDLLDSGLSGVPTTDRWLAAEKFARVPAPGGHDPARDPTLLRLGTDRGGDR